MIMHARKRPVRRPRPRSSKTAEQPVAATGLARYFWPAGLGALTAPDDEGPPILERLVDYGWELESRGRRTIREQQELVVKTIEEGLYEWLSRVFARFGVATRMELTELTASVASLAEKVDRLADALDHVRLRGRLVPSATGQPRTFRVVARNGGWEIGREGRPHAISLHATKEEAVERARSLAHQLPPSRLDVYKKDGTLQETLNYPS